MSNSRTALRQRADLTHKPNLKSGRHGWLRLTPAYGVKVVEEIVSAYPDLGRMRIFDPFCGTATTALSAAYHGHHGVTTDINPFLVWLGRAKTAHYDARALASARQACAEILDRVRTGKVEPTPAPSIHNIERWWSPDALHFLRSLKAAIEGAAAPGTPAHTLLLIAFCRTLISVSNAAFNHQSMSFKDSGQLSLVGVDMFDMFANDVNFVLRGAAENPSGGSEILLGDARDNAAAGGAPFDLVVTSPPYANRMSYIRELRPYMYWLGYLTTGREAGELDWMAIGGTWGMATSRLGEWTRPKDHFASAPLQRALNRIARGENQSGKLLANYVAKYFDDMWLHFRSLTPHLAPDARLHYIVGNSTFYGVLLPVEKFYEDMLAQLGFVDVAARAIRKRNSKKELVEFDVTARWRG